VRFHMRIEKGNIRSREILCFPGSKNVRKE
jgi:hypothetical protein